MLDLIIIYLCITAAVFFLSNRSMFPAPASSYVDSEKIIKLTTADKTLISARYLHNPNAKYTIIFSHGNAEDLGTVEPFLQLLYNLGFSVLGYDYQGYGTSQGSASEHATYQDINSAYKYLIEQKKIDPQHIILYGRSIGTGPTVELAANNDVAAVILEGAFVSAYRVITYYPIFLFDKFNNLSKINAINVPILFVHGVQDGVIPIWHAKKLYAEYAGAKQAYWVEGAGHNNLNYVAGEKFNTVIRDFVESLNNKTINQLKIVGD